MKVLLDTSFLLPSLGIDVGPEAIKALQKLEENRAEIYFSQFSILEALWVIVRLRKAVANNLEGVATGIKSMVEGGLYKRVIENSEVFADALSLYFAGHRDLIDNILYADSDHFDMKLLTLDAQLRSFMKARSLKDTTITPENIA